MAWVQDMEALIAEYDRLDRIAYSHQGLTREAARCTEAAGAAWQKVLAHFDSGEFTSADLKAVKNRDLLETAWNEWFYAPKPSPPPPPTTNERVSHG